MREGRARDARVPSDDADIKTSGPRPPTLRPAPTPGERSPL